VAQTLDALLVAWPEPRSEQPQHLCLDKGCDYRVSEQAVAECDYRMHQGCIGEQELDGDGGGWRI
jgi:hypothetical protein